jgi:DNA-binding transcriptional LysR family regulator
VRHIDPYSLRLFVAVAEARSLSRAAAKEHIAPSALSRRVADLERVFGTPLLVRSPHGISLTGAGEVVARRAADIEQDYLSLLREVHGYGGRMAGTVRLFVCSPAIVGFLPERLKKFQDRHRQVTVNLQERLGEEVVRACADDRADVGVAEVAKDVPGTLESWAFGIDPLVVSLPRNHPLARRRSLRFGEILPFPMVSVQPGSSIDRLLHDHAGNNGGRLRVCVSVNGFDAGCRMVQAGFGLLVKPKSVAALYEGRQRLVSRPLQEAWADNEQRVYALRMTPRPRVVEALIESLRG